MKIWEFPFFQNLSVSDRKGLTSRVAQYISPGIILILINHAPDYQNQQRKKLYPTKPGSLKFRALATGLSHLYVVSGLSEVLRSFRSARLSAVAFISFSSPVFRCCFRVLLHVARSATVSSQVAVLMSIFN